MLEAQLSAAAQEAEAPLELAAQLVPAQLAAVVCMASEALLAPPSQQLPRQLLVLQVLQRLAALAHRGPRMDLPGAPEEVLAEAARLQHPARRLLAQQLRPGRI